MQGYLGPVGLILLLLKSKIHILGWSNCPGSSSVMIGLVHFRWIQRINSFDFWFKCQVLEGEIKSIRKSLIQRIFVSKFYHRKSFLSLLCCWDFRISSKEGESSLEQKKFRSSMTDKFLKKELKSFFLKFLESKLSLSFLYGYKIRIFDDIIEPSIFLIQFSLNQRPKNNSKILNWISLS